MLIYFNLSVTNQHFQVDIFRESVITGNDAIFSCSVPSFVADFVRVDSWVDSEGNLLTRAVSGNEETSHLMHSPVACSENLIFYFFFQLRTRDMKSIYLRRALSLAMMQFSNAQFPVLYLILCLWSLGETLRPIALVLVFWVKIVVGIFFSVNSIKDIISFLVKLSSHLPLVFQFQVRDTRLTSSVRALSGATTLSSNARYQALCLTLSVLIHGLILKQII